MTAAFSFHWDGMEKSKHRLCARNEALALSLTALLASGVVSAQSPATNGAATGVVVAPSATEVKQLISKQAEQTALIQKLLGRLDQLEKDKEAQAQRADSAEKARQAEVRKLEAQIKALEGKIVDLESGRAVATLAATPGGGSVTNVTERQSGRSAQTKAGGEGAEPAHAKEGPHLSVGSGGFVLSSADTNFVLKLRGLVQLDSRSFFDANPDFDGDDGFLLRRARPIFAGTVYRDFDFLLTPDFAGSSPMLVDAWINYRYRPELQLRFGKMKGPVGLERLQSGTVGSFNERSMASDLVPSRSVGVQLGGDIAGGVASYALGIYNPAGDYRNAANGDFNDHLEFGGRLFIEPFKDGDVSGLRGLGLGVGGSYADLTFDANALPNTTGGSLPGYVTAGQQQFFAYNPAVGTVQADGAHWRFSPQGYYYVGPFGLMGEYVISEQGVFNTATQARAQLRNAAWQASAQWVLTGEAASFNGIVPQASFDPRLGNWGAWQVVARVSQLKIDNDAFPVFSNPNTSANEAFEWSVGLNWWLNRNIRVLTSFSYTTFDGGMNPALPAPGAPPGTVAAQDEKVFFTRLQLSF